jgi:hypothetical protein
MFAEVVAWLLSNYASRRDVGSVSSRLCPEIAETALRNLAG